MSDQVKVQPISGFPEWLPNFRLAEQRLIATIREQYELFGFSPIETAAVERIEVLTAKGGMQRQIYTIGRPEEDQEDSVVGLGLHFDLTVPLARYVVQHAEELTFPFRRYQIQKVWRGERPQRGRFREFYQCDVDIVGRGSLDLLHDAEMPCAINATLEALGLSDFQVHVSNRQVLAALLATLAVPESAGGAVLREIDKSDKRTPEETRQGLIALGLESSAVETLFELKRCATVVDARRLFERIGAPTGALEELQTVIDRAVALGMPPARIRANFAVARGLDYYTGTVYETFVLGKENWGSICSGGRYEDLASHFTTQKYPGVGVSIGLSRLFSLLIDAGVLSTSSQSPTRVMVAMQDRKNFLDRYLELGSGLRAASIPCEVYMEPHALRDQIGYASAKGIPYLVIAGGREFDSQTVLVKDLERRTQETVPASDLISYLQQRLAPA
ncbi:MAG: histidine--tRNA ligase [Planctomycetales bacterium]